MERLALEFLAYCVRLEPILAREIWAVNGQLQRTAASVVSNVGEALDSASLPQKGQYFGYAVAAAGEGERLLRAARLAGVIRDPVYAEGMKTLRDLKMDLRRLLNWTRRPRL